jgi:2-haloacid dehalogenase
LSPPVRALLLDLGGVLIDWDPRHLYRKLFPGDEGAMERFLATVCTPEWNEAQDAGRSFAEGVAELVARHPRHAALIEAFRARWEEMIPGPIAGAPELLRELKASGLPVHALSNWSAETWPIAVQRFDFLAWFDSVVISGPLGLRKPDPAIFRHAAAHCRLEPRHTLFVDDSPRNVEAALHEGFQALRFESSAALRGALVECGVLPPRSSD